MTAPSNTPPPAYPPAGTPAPAYPPGSTQPPAYLPAEAFHTPVADETAPGRPDSRAARLWRGRPEDPAWARPAFLGLLLGTLVLYLWDLSASGYANSFYSAAVQAGSQSWKAFFFGSSDAANAITVDKPPAALWPMALSVRLFGLGSWQILVPEALMGVATVGVLYAAVRRRFSAGAGLLAGAVLAVTPVAALMFRFNNPDALLALLMVTAVYCVLRALEGARTRWLVLAGVVFGLAFLTKTLQAWLILPPLAVVYAVCAPTPLRRRLLQLLYAGLAMVLAGGWWVTIVELWPASSRPYIGGSQDNSFLGLTFGYNGFGRITGNETGSVGGGGAPGGGGGQWGQTGIGRLFEADMGGQIAWLLPAAFLALVAGLVLTRQARRADTARAAFLVWGGALLMTFATFSFMSGIFHQYYNIGLAPYIAALVGMGASMLWQRRGHVAAAATLAVGVLGTSLWSADLLGRSSGWHPWLRTAVVVAGIAAALGLVLASRPGRTLARVGTVGAVVGLAAALGGPVAYTLDTVTTGHTGSIVTAGPSVRGGGFPGGGGRMPGGGRGFPGGGRGFGNGGTAGRGMPQFPGGGMPGGTTGQAPQGGQNGQNGFPGMPGGGTGTGQGNSQGNSQGNGAQGQGRFGGGGGGGMGGLLDGAKVSSQMSALLKADADTYTWVAAAIGSQNQASYQLATQKPVMSIGGFNGSDPSPTLAQFQKYVADGRIHYFIGGGGFGGGGGMGGSGTASQISTWVEAHFTAKTVGSTTVYDLTQPKS
ncbi:4-amino-4-deoxy-L-arabinose transferase [Actinacidiphila rubida]|uniref:4-amino-4-deoxy-L-arabinose transferase n=1 Tax=Actinacidiphila rubida TaxID=310780 RepID=A0A1H8QSG9_9ACTN|nr:glycosyltransferase family 39 protein [Actinacidiphila rubida]SEO56891.1 4-amino-4-deoxy-L-arabinose transferase [Actinacidiphila rubida]